MLIHNFKNSCKIIYFSNQLGFCIAVQNALFSTE